MEEKTVTIPYISEQKKISKILSFIDTNITLQQDKLKKLKLLQNYLLQKLFI